MLLAVASISFVGIGMVTAVLPLISPEKGAQLGFIAQGLLLVVSGVYYPVEVMPGWMQWLAALSPATYALEGIRAAILDGAGLGELGGDLWPLAVLGVVSIPLGLRGVPRGRALRQAARQAQAERLGVRDRVGCPPRPMQARNASASSARGSAIRRACRACSTRRSTSRACG